MHVHVLFVHGLSVCFIEEAALIVFAAAGLDGEDVRHGVREDAGEAVLCLGGSRGERKYPAVHRVGVDDIDNKHCYENEDEGRGSRRQHRDREDDRGERRPEAVGQDIHKARVAAHEAGGLAYKRPSEPSCVEGHALVRECVEAEARELVVAVDLELVDRIVLELRERLAHGVHDKERQDIRAEDRKDLVGCDGGGLDAVDDEAHHVGIRKREEGNVAHRGYDRKGEGAGLLLRHPPEVVEGAPDGRAVIRIGCASECHVCSGISCCLKA